MQSLRGKIPWLVLAGVILAADLWTKAVIYESMLEHHVDWVLGSWLGYTKVLNTGMMYGAFQGFAGVLRWLRVAAAVVVLAMIRSTPRGSHLLLIALGLILGGALGNIYDGFAYEGVRDFIRVDIPVPGLLLDSPVEWIWFLDGFPVFNVADSAICVGVAMLALGLIREDRRAASSAGQSTNEV